MYKYIYKSIIYNKNTYINIINNVSIISKNMLFIFCIKSKDNVLI